jgi:hypothetical protein
LIQSENNVSPSAIFTRCQRNLNLFKPETHQLYRLKRADSSRKVLLAITIQDSGPGDLGMNHSVCTCNTHTQKNANFAILRNLVWCAIGSKRRLCQASRTCHPQTSYSYINSRLVSAIKTDYKRSRRDVCLLLRGMAIVGWMWVHTYKSAGEYNLSCMATPKPLMHL